MTRSDDRAEAVRRRIAVVGAVIVEDRRVLAAQRAKGALSGLWEFPGGKVEAEETPEDALRRELREELLIEASIGDVVTTTEHENASGTIVLTTYLCTVRSGTPRAVEHRAIRWVPIGELMQLDWAPADVPTVEIMTERSRVRD